MKRVKFLVDFANKRVGDVVEYTHSLASQLVVEDKVAEYTTDKVTEISSENEHIELTDVIEPTIEENYKEEELVVEDKVVEEEVIEKSKPKK